MSPIRPKVKQIVVYENEINKKKKNGNIKLRLAQSRKGAGMFKPVLS